MSKWVWTPIADVGPLMQVSLSSGNAVTRSVFGGRLQEHVNAIESTWA